MAKKGAVLEPARSTEAATILERAVCLTLDCHYIGNNRKVDLRKVVEAAIGANEMLDISEQLDERQFHTTMRLIDTKELQPCMRLLGKAKQVLRARAIPTHRVFGERTYLIPLAAMKAVDDDLTGVAAMLRIEAIALAERYEAAIDRQREAVGPLLFRRSRYLPTSAVASAFQVDWSYVSFAAPDKLETVDRAIAQAAHAKYDRKLADAFDEVVSLLRGEALDVMRELEERLTPGPDGKPKVLRGTALRDLQDYLRYLPERNLADDGQLTTVMARVSALAEGLDVQDLRDSDALRTGLRAAAGAAKAVLAELVATGRRGISLGILEADG